MHALICAFTFVNSARSSVCSDTASVCRCLGMEICCPSFHCQSTLAHCGYIVGLMFFISIFVSLEPALMSYKLTILNYGCSWTTALISSMFLTCLSDSGQVSFPVILQSFLIQRGYQSKKQIHQCGALSQAAVEAFGKCSVMA